MQRTEPRRRPKDRKLQIATVAAEAFSARGYHGVGVDEIAAVVGISGPALYRHFPNKYALFLRAATDLADTLDVALAADAAHDCADPAERLNGQLLAAIRTTVTHRRTAGLYRWESRYLAADDRARIRATIETVNQRIADTLTDLRPGLPARDAVQLCVAMLGVIGSITVHRTTLPPRRLERLLQCACRAVAGVELVAVDDGVPSALPVVDASSGDRREALLGAAVTAFHARGYHEVSIEDIAAAAGITASGVYRHFTGKADLLAAAFHRAADRLADATTTALNGAPTSRDALTALVDVYVRLSFQQSELMSVYVAELASLPDGPRTELRAVQRHNTDQWAHLLADTRPELSATDCRFLVHAAFALVLDVGRILHFDATASNQARVRTLVEAVLFGG
ncbi:TetR/AcrR family transcriptional regulator [Prescottella subtropica]|uniref:TetR/AcrR family transcriptional regulator n=1 Tax=Prescottella subtropica TaxID=2545757 RepID=UPI001F50050F|nr:TetR/AcrR family transcriptional regulator [Prescottella subtropica]